MSVQVKNVVEDCRSFDSLRSLRVNAPRNDKKGFTLVELMVVVAIIAILSVIGITVFNGAQRSARDAKRKADLDAIHTALEVYFYNNGKYPQARNDTHTCAYGSNCYVFSTEGSNWIKDLVPSYMAAVPVDPKNTLAYPLDPGPWIKSNYVYSYGNVCATGEPGCTGDTYDLTAQLENTADSDRCGVKNYKFYFDNRSWCAAFGGGYYNQIYEKSPLTPI